MYWEYSQVKPSVVIVFLLTSKGGSPKDQLQHVPGLGSYLFGWVISAWNKDNKSVGSSIQPQCYPFCGEKIEIFQEFFFFSNIALVFVKERRHKTDVFL
jgi:hypothetical protein